MNNNGNVAAFRLHDCLGGRQHVSTPPTTPRLFFWGELEEEEDEEQGGSKAAYCCCWARGRGQGHVVAMVATTTPQLSPLPLQMLRYLTKDDDSRLSHFALLRAAGVQALELAAACVL